MSLQLVQAVRSFSRILFLKKFFQFEIEIYLRFRHFEHVFIRTFLGCSFILFSPYLSFVCVPLVSDWFRGSAVERTSGLLFKERSDWPDLSKMVPGMKFCFFD